MTGRTDATRNGARSARNQSWPWLTGRALAVAIDSLERVCEAHVSDEVPVPVHRADREASLEVAAALLHERDFLLEQPRVHCRLQEPRHELRDALRNVERRHGHLAHDLLRPVAEQSVRAASEGLHGPLQVARDHGLRALHVVVAESLRALSVCRFHGLSRLPHRPGLYRVGGLPVNHAEGHASFPYESSDGPRRRERAVLPEQREPRSTPIICGRGRGYAGCPHSAEKRTPAERRDRATTAGAARSIRPRSLRDSRSRRSAERGDGPDRLEDPAGPP